MSRTKTITITLGSLTAGAMLATGITGLAMAADTTPDSGTTSTNAPADGSYGGPGGGMPDGGRHGGPDGGRHGGPDGGMPGMRGGPLGDAVHGETVVKAADGTFTTIRMVRGTVTAVGADSISVRAEDGFAATFAVNADTEVHTGLPTRPTEGSVPTAPTAGAITDVSVGDVAMVRGTGEASAATADDIHAMTAAEAAQFEQERAAHEAQRQSGTGATQAG